MTPESTKQDEDQAITLRSERNELTPDDLVAQAKKIQQVLKEVMKEGYHYGLIPGCGDKPALLKPGAEKLCLLFRLAPTYTVEVQDLGNGHREYQVTCRLHHIPSGDFIGSGLGTCSTMESKYLFRTQNTRKPVPGDYWKYRDPELLGGPQYSPRKIEGKWMILEKIKHDNPADYYNTCLKMGEKRSLIGAIRVATGASDIFIHESDDPPAANPVNTPGDASVPGSDEIPFDGN